MFTVYLFQTAPFVMERIFDYPVTPEAKERMSFEERYEGFCVDLIKVIYLSHDSRLMPFEERYEGFCVALIKKT